MGVSAEYCTVLFEYAGDGRETENWVFDPIELAVVVFKKEENEIISIAEVLDNSGIK